LFESCEGFFGGAVYIHLNANEFDEFIVPLKIINVEFDGCKATVGKFVFVDSAKEYDITWLNQTLEFVQNNINKDSNYIIDLDPLALSGIYNHTTDIIPLKIYWMKFDGTVYISGNGNDNKLCGFEYYPCLSIDASVQTINLDFGSLTINCIDIDEKSINIIRPLRFNLEIMIQTRDGENHPQNVKFIEDFVSLTFFGKTRIESLCFQFPYNFNVGIQSFITVNNEIFIQDCVFKGINEEFSVVAFSLINIINGNLTINKTKFSKISSEGSTGAAINGEIGEECALVITDSIFEHLSASNESWGGAIYVYLNKGSFVVTKTETEHSLLSNDGISGTTFINCTGGFGGGIYIDISEEVLKIDDEETLVKTIFSTVLLDLVSFSECESYFGNNIFIRSPVVFSQFDLPNKLKFVEKLPEDKILKIPDEDLIGIVTSDGQNYIPLKYYFMDLKNPIYVSPFGRNLEICGFSDFPCSTIQQSTIVAEYLEENTTNVNVVIRGPVLDMSERVINLNIPTSITSDEDPIVIVTVGPLIFVAPIFEVNAELEISNLHFNVSEGSSTTDTFFLLSNFDLKIENVSFNISKTEIITSPFVRIDSQNKINVIFTNCLFTGFTLIGNGAAINALLLDDQKLTITNCTFNETEVQGNSSQGGAIYVNISSEASLVIHGGAFINCSAPVDKANGRGGAIAVYIQSNSTSNIIIFKDFEEIHPLTFKDCKASVGVFIYLDGVNLGSIVNKNSFAYSYSLENPNELVGVNNHVVDSIIYLKVYLCPLRKPERPTAEKLFDCDKGCVEYVV
jgi:hypothetical protein